MTSTQPARGTRDFLPGDLRCRHYVIDVVRDVYRRYGFEPLETPAFENIATLMGKYGEEGNQLIFKILRRGEHEASGQADLALRYDLTVPLARVVAQYQSETAEVLQALPDPTRLARRSARARPLPRVLPVRHRRHRVDVARRRGRTARGGQRRALAAGIYRLHDPAQPPARAHGHARVRRHSGGPARRGARGARQAGQDRCRRRGR